MTVTQGLGPNGAREITIDTSTGATSYELPPSPASGLRYVVRHSTGPAPATVTVASGKTIDDTTNATKTLPVDTEMTFFSLDAGAWQSYTSGGGQTLQATGVAATDTAAIMAAHDGLPAAGGEIRLGAGTFVVTAGTVIFTKPVRLVGAGCSGGATSTAAGYPTETSITKITCSSPTGNAIAFGSGAHGFSVENLHIINTSTAAGNGAPTAGAGAAVTAQLAGYRFENVTIAGFYRNFDLGNGYEWFMDSCNSYDYVYSGIRIANPSLPDAGDGGVVNCQITAGPNNAAATAAVEWISAGGLRFVGNKINRRGAGSLTYGMYFHPADGMTTSVFAIGDNSFENCQYGIGVADQGNTGSGFISKMMITGNEFLCSVRSIAFARTQSAHTSLITITGNVFTTAGALNAIDLANVASVVLAGNVYASNITTQLTIGSGVTSLFLAPGYSFTTAGRPAATVMAPGSTYYDTTLSKPAWSDGTNWKDAAGTNV